MTNYGYQEARRLGFFCVQIFGSSYPQTHNFKPMSISLPSFAFKKQLHWVLLTTLSIGTFSCQKTDDTISAPQQPEVVNSNHGYLKFKDRAAFESIASKLDDIPKGKSIDVSLNEWEAKLNNFHSLRKYHEELLVNPSLAKRGSSVDDGVISDDYFASLLSPEGTLQIDDNIYRIDVENQKVYYINGTDQGALYSELISENPDNPDIKYFDTSDTVLDLLDSGQEGKPCPVTSDSVTYVERCSDGSANRSSAYFIDGYQEGYRNDCKLDYEKYGIYFSIIAKMQCQQRTFPSPFWTSYNSPSASGNIHAIFKPKCWGQRDQSDSKTVSNDNKVSFRPWESTRGLTSFNIDVEFASTGSGLVRMHIQN
jgi:hypothetical protein